MVFEPMNDEQKRRFFRQGCAPHLPGYTGHCPTLKFRVGKRFGACTEEIIKELIERKIFHAPPCRLENLDKENLPPVKPPKEIKRDWKKESYIYKNSPFILGYTGYIPGFNTRYGLTFMKAVEEGEKEWKETQNKLRARRDAMRAHAERVDPRNLLSRVRTDNVETEIDHGFDKKKQYFDNQVSVEKPPIVGYTGHIPGAKSHIALSKRYAEAAKKGLQLLQKERESSELSKNSMERVLEVSCLDETGHAKA